MHKCIQYCVDPFHASHILTCFGSAPPRRSPSVANSNGKGRFAFAAGQQRRESPAGICLITVRVADKAQVVLRCQNAEAEGECLNKKNYAREVRLDSDQLFLENAEPQRQVLFDLMPRQSCSMRECASRQPGHCILRSPCTRR